MTDLVREITIEPGTQPAETDTSSGFEHTTRFTRGPDGLVEAIAAIGTTQTRKVDLFYPADRVFVGGTRNAKGHETRSFVAPALGAEVAADDASGVRVHRTFDTFGVVRSETDPRSYDIEVHQAAGSDAEVAGLRLVEIRPVSGDGAVSKLLPPSTRLAFDVFGRLVRHDSPGWGGERVVEEWGFDRFDRLTYWWLPRFTTHERRTPLSYDYDNAGRLTLVTYPDLSLSSDIGK